MMFAFLRMVKTLFLCIIVLPFTVAGYSLNIFRKVNKAASAYNYTVDSLNGIGLAEINNLPDSSIIHFKRAISVELKINNKSVLGQLYNRIGAAYFNKADYPTALSYYFKSLEIRQKSHNKREIASTLVNISNTYNVIGDYKKALDFGLKSLAINERIHLISSISINYNSLANIYSNIHAYKKALAFYKNAASIYEESNDTTNLGIVYGNIGSSYKELGQIDSAFYFFKQAAQFDSLMNNTLELAGAYNNIGGLYCDRNNYELGLDYYKQSFSLYNKVGDQKGIVETLINLGVNYNNKHVFKKALECYFKALKVADDIGDNVERLSIYENISITYAAEGLFYKAYEFHNLYGSLKDSLLNETNNRQMTEMQIKYETEQKDQQIQSDKKIKNQKTIELNISIAGIFLIVMLSGFLIYNYRQKIRANLKLARKSEELNDQKINALLTEQDIKFAGAMIEGQECERKRIAEDLHDRLGIMLSTIKLHFSSIRSDIKENLAPSLQQSDIAEKLLDEACTEVRQIAHSMASGVLAQSGLLVALSDLNDAIEKSRKIKFALETHGLEDRLEASIEIAVYRVLQELIGNVLKHAEASEVTVSLNRYEDRLNIIVEDNGKGFGPEGGELNKGMGLKNVSVRVQKLQGEMTMDSKEGRGTTVIIDIPLNTDKALF
jgi:two-component system NarL family sensor kinase